MVRPEVKVVFSDLDGTLVHYPKEFLEYADIISEQEASENSPEKATIKYKETNETRECIVLTSMTGGKAYMSLKTKELIKELRELQVLFVIITGARSSTYAKRRGLLPPADFEFFENGGRKLAQGILDAEWTDQFESQIGPVTDRESLVPDMPPPEERSGSLWGLLGELLQDGWNIDARNYVTNFRVDVKKSHGKQESDFKEVVDRECKKRGLTSSYNLGKADIYPAASGKANAARHILELKKIDKEYAVGLFDDDNDIELGTLCGRSFLPGVTHPSVLEALSEHPSWTLMDRKGFLGTEMAVEKVLEICRAAPKPKSGIPETVSAN